ncbi:hypothetical protein LA5095_05302 [Roseibium album]|uniref:Uncharacterized protein n=1 Tax=Roseibium album TaxID=311410 RepID=A0A0M7B079_9HYPH|nr:hypothetical protein LA5094_05093 [Roseibium album]CTQ77861.1 hypothetical protein LA5096_05320 [Roseibium album]CTQ80072.1 hypothetical protein LA5095_05302 [Roseibium album]
MEGSQRSDSFLIGALQNLFAVPALRRDLNTQELDIRQIEATQKGER